MSTQPAQPDEADAGPKKDSIGGWFKSTAASLEGHMKEMRENTKQIAQDFRENTKQITQDVADFQKGITKARRPNETCFDITFAERQLGLELDLKNGAVVRAVKPGGQAEALQVCAQDRLVAIAGEPLPPVEDSDQFVEAVKQRMSKMPRPVTLTFGRLPPEPHGEDAEPPQDAARPPRPAPGSRGSGQNAEDAPATAAELQAELAAARGKIQRYQALLKEAKEALTSAKDDAKVANEDAVAAVEDAAALRADLADLQLSKVWNAQEVKRSQAEAEAAQREVSQLTAQLEDLRRERADSERAAVAERDELAERLGGLEAAKSEAAAASEAKLKQVQDELTGMLEEVRQQLRVEQAAHAESKLQWESSSASVEARVREAEEKRAGSIEEMTRLEANYAAERECASEARAELRLLESEMEKRTAKAVATDRILVELRREVERLHLEVKSYEAGAGGMIAERRNSELTDQVHQLQEAVRHHEERAASANKQVSDLTSTIERLQNLGAGSAQPPAMEKPGADGGGGDTRAAPRLVEAQPRKGNWETGHEQRVAVDGGGLGDVELGAGDALDAPQLHARVSELEAENAGLKKQLSSRPIVFQFDPLLNDGYGGAPEDAPDEEDPKAEEAGDSGAGGLSCRMFVYLALVVCRRRTYRAYASCRRQRTTKTMERSLRQFTRSMLKNPLLLWLFYVHVLVLWIVEFWRQAVSQSMPTDPTHRINQLVAAAAKTRLLMASLDGTDR